jgi:transcriptional regulator with XRE-family HTH domain
MTKSFREALLDAVIREGTSLRAVATRANVSYEQLKKLSQGKSQSTNVDDAVLIAHSFGLSLDEFLGDTTIQDRAQAIALWQQLSEAERDLLKAAARGLRAQVQPED